MSDQKAHFSRVNWVYWLLWCALGWAKCACNYNAMSVITSNEDWFSWEMYQCFLKGRKPLPQKIWGARGAEKSYLAILTALSMSTLGSRRQFARLGVAAGVCALLWQNRQSALVQHNAFLVPSSLRSQWTTLSWLIEGGRDASNLTLLLWKPLFLETRPDIMR